MKVVDQNDEAIILQAEKLYNSKVIKENTLGNSANLIFEMKGHKSIIPRISEYSERKEDHINFELRWVAYLSNEMSNIVKPIASLNKNLYEMIECNNKKYLLYALEKANGRTVNIKEPAEYNETLFFNIGSIMGRMHQMTKKYNDYDESAYHSFAWYNSWNFWPEYNIVVDEEVHMYEKKYIRYLQSLPKSDDVYGIIHDDIQWLNFFVSNNHIKIFDFDDCEFCWYAKDIASTLFQFVQQGTSYKNQKERTEFAEEFLISYLKGYLTENPINEYWITQLDMFMKYRRTTTYKYIQNAFKDKTHNPHDEYLCWLKNEILLDTPFVEINYGKVIDILGI